MEAYSTIPTQATGSLERFKIDIPEEKLLQFKQLIKLSPIAPVTRENQQEDRRFGVSRDWLISAQKQWLEDFDWYDSEGLIV